MIREVLVAVLLLASQVTPSKAQYVLTINDVDYDKETFEISNYKWPEAGRKSIVVPSELDGNPVKSIGLLCFFCHKSVVPDTSDYLTSVVISEGVESVGDFAFMGNNITSLSLPSSLRSIGQDAFRLACSLPRLDLPSSVEYLGTGAFFGCHIRSLTLSPNTEVIPSECFAGNLLECVNIPDGVRRIATHAFHSNRIKAISIPASVSYLSGFQLNQIESIDIPGTVSAIGSYAFADNPLTSVNICQGVDSILDGAFTDTTIDGILSDVVQLQTISIPSSVVYIGVKAFAHVHALQSVTFSDGLRRIDSMAFMHCGFSSVSLPPSLSVVGSGAFALCTSLAHVDFAEGLVEICGDAFKLANLSEVSLPNSLMKIGANAFHFASDGFISLPSCGGRKTWSAFDGENLVTDAAESINGKVGPTASYSYVATLAGDVESVASMPVSSAPGGVFDLAGRRLERRPSLGFLGRMGRRGDVVVVR